MKTFFTFMYKMIIYLKFYVKTVMFYVLHVRNVGASTQMFRYCSFPPKNDGFLKKNRKFCRFLDTYKVCGSQMFSIASSSTLKF